MVPRTCRARRHAPIVLRDRQATRAVVHRLHNAMSTDAVPVLTVRQAHLASLALTLGYVGSLYVSRLFRRAKRTNRTESTRAHDSLAGAPLAAEVGSDAVPRFDDQDSPRSYPSEPDAGPPPGTRDHPDEIRARIQAVTVSTVASCLGVHSLAGRHVKFGEGNQEGSQH